MPQAAPTMAVSLMGVSITRSGPNLASNPSVTLNAPPYTPMSSPRATTAGSRSISSNIAWRMASSMVISAIVSASLLALRALPERLAATRVVVPAVSVSNGALKALRFGGLAESLVFRPAAEGNAIRNRFALLRNCFRRRRDGGLYHGLLHGLGRLLRGFFAVATRAGGTAAASACFTFAVSASSPPKSATFHAALTLESGGITSCFGRCQSASMVWQPSQ